LNPFGVITTIGLGGTFETGLARAGTLGVGLPGIGLPVVLILSPAFLFVAFVVFLASPFLTGLRVGLETVPLLDLVFLTLLIDALTDFVRKPQIGAQGLVYVKYNSDQTIKSSIDNTGQRVVVRASYEDPTQPDIIHNRIIRASD
jgi:hypothetical protein